MKEQGFASFLEALRHGDPQALEKLDQDYRPLLHDVIAGKLAGGDLRRAADESDICQSVLFKFFQRIQTDQFHFDNPSKLRGLLLTMALNKLRDLARRETARRQGPPGAAPGKRGQAGEETADDRSSPSQHVALEDFVREFLRRLSPEARRVYAWKAEGWTWERIGRELGQRASSARMRYRREMRRAARELGLESTGESP